jgi:hypothetical protein
MTGQWLPTRAWLWLILPAVTWCLCFSICGLLYAPNWLYRPVASGKPIIHLDCTTNTNRCSCLMHPTLYSSMCDHEALHRALHIATSTPPLNSPSRNRIAAVTVDRFVELHLTRELLDRMTVNCSRQVCIIQKCGSTSLREAISNLKSEVYEDTTWQGDLIKLLFCIKTTWLYIRYPMAVCHPNLKVLWFECWASHE